MDMKQEKEKALLLLKRKRILNAKRKQNIQQFTNWFIPLIIISKIVRWTILKPQLVDTSIGWYMVKNIYQDKTSSFSINGNATENSIILFDFINIFNIRSYIGWEIFFTIILNIPVFFMIKEYYRTHPLTKWRENLFIYMNVAILNIFCFNMAKEPYQMLFFILMYYCIMLRNTTYMKKCFLIIGVLLLCTFLARRYYALVIMFFVFLVFTVGYLFKKNARKKLTNKQLTVYITLMLLAICGLHYLFMAFMGGKDPETYLELIRVNNRVGSLASSEITPIFNANGGPLFTAEYFIKIFRLLFPVELLLKGKITYIFLIVNQLLLVTFMIRAFKGMGGKGNSTRLTQTSSVSTRNIALFTYIAFLLCSAAFEPDFGSWVRHQGVTFPIILLIL